MPEKVTPKGDQVRWYRMTFESKILTRVFRLRGDVAVNDRNEAIGIAVQFAKDPNLIEWPLIEDVTEEVTQGKPVKKD